MFDDGLTYQDSHMSSVAEFVDGMEKFDITAPQNVHGGPVLCRDGNAVYVDGSDSHTLIVGDTNSMKTLKFVLPLIYTCSMAGESMVIVDPKGELARKAEGFLKRSGYETAIVNLRYPQKSPDTWNPMDIVSKSYAQGHDGRQNAILQLNDLLNNLFFSRSTHSKDEYWIEAAGQVALGLCQLILYLDDEELNMKNLLRWRFEKMRDGTLKKIYKTLSEDSEIYQNLAVYMDLKAESTQSCILSTFDQLIRIFKSSPALTEMLSNTTFDIDAIGEKKVAVFMVVPDEKTTLHFLATLFISQCYSSLLEAAEKYNGTLPRRVNFILEEFCNLPKLNDILSMITAARSRNIRIHMVIQSYSQLIDKYGSNISKAILDNCGNLVYLHSREVEFLKYISELAGKNEFGYPLMSASRLQRIKKNETLIFHDRCYPFLAEDIPLIFDYPVTLGSRLREKKVSLADIMRIADDDFMIIDDDRDKNVSLTDIMRLRLENNDYTLLDDDYD